MKQGLLIRYEADLRADEFSERKICMAPEFCDWLDGTLRKKPKDRGQLLPYEQVSEVFRRFIVGKRMHLNSDLNKLVPHPKGVWEVKTKDVRVFGYFYQKREYVAVSGGMKADIKRGKYGAHVKGVETFRKSLPKGSRGYDNTPTEKFNDLL